MKSETFVILLSFVVIAVFLSTIPSNAAVEVKLKNGRTIYAETYWIEGNFINLQFKSGIMKMRKDEIHSITEIKGKIPDDEESTRTPETKPEAKPIQKPTSTTKEEKPPTTVSEKEEVETYKKKKKEIQARLDEAKKAHSEAKTKAEKEKAWKELMSISKEMHQFYQEMVEKNKGTVPKWWGED